MVISENRFSSWLHDIHTIFSHRFGGLQHFDVFGDDDALARLGGIAFQAHAVCAGRWLESVAGLLGRQLSLKAPDGRPNGFHQGSRGAHDLADGLYAHFADGAGGGFGGERVSSDHTNQRSQFVICAQTIGGSGCLDLCWAMDAQHHGGLHPQNLRVDSNLDCVRLARGIF